MNRNDLRRVDLNLLIVFETLMHERSVTRAAEKLFLGQPAISAALSRLRTLFDDPLFVRTGRSMEPTARAQEIFAHLSPALDSISTAMSRASEFDPATSTAVFRIGLSDDVEFGLLPPLLRRLRAEAPGIVLVDEELEKFGRKRKVVLAVPQFNGLGTLLAGTDIIATVPDYAAQALIAAGGLRAEDPPFETRAFELSMAWRGAQDNDPAERWLRSRISMFIGDPDSL
ncbi:LysR family transcriptional regulator [Pseudomonas aeruginosa]|uniref:LysR family transcriptional regulator n=1 Tax=Pseudomonas aeruginosa TaxID=287 RepID=UPI000F82BEB9|nr:LysR family transcriptional regulator [Pseudomonas aeruginosa]RTS97593.1 LysR family transcriptional regulator [Pseudomonas aeruginosa]